MKTKITLYCLYLFIIQSCTVHNDFQYYFSKEGILNDIDSISGDSKNARAVYVDSSIIKKSGILIDSNFILVNLKKIDNSIIHNKYLNEQGFSYTFWIIDTIKLNKLGDFLLVRGRYLYKYDPRVIMDQYKLFIMSIKGDSVVSVYELAHSMENVLNYEIKYSVILSDFRIHSRKIYHHCSDFDSGKGFSCITNLVTDFIYFSETENSFVKYKPSYHIWLE